MSFLTQKCGANVFRYLVARPTRFWEMAKFFIEHPFELKEERSSELGIHIQMRQYGIYEFVFVLLLNLASLYWQYSQPLLINDSPLALLLTISTKKEHDAVFDKTWSFRKFHQVWRKVNYSKNSIVETGEKKKFRFACNLPFLNGNAILRKDMTYAQLLH